ncbi:MAG: prepilin peptidase [Eubacteriales bacterium]|nr:prepilin peptidase [Eubacteriales bacterium]
MSGLSPFWRAYLLFAAAVFGLVFGSFGNAWAWRTVHGESIARGRSHCASCGHALGAADLVPLFSFLLLRGRCRYCGEKISPRYPLAEALCAAVFVSFAARFGASPQTLGYCVLGFLLFVLSLVDLDSCIIPDRFLVLAAADFVVFTVLTAPDTGKALLGGLIGGLALAVPMLALVLLADRALGRESMGGGDLKLLFVLGLFTGPARGLLMLILACVIGLLFALLPGVRGRDADNPRAFPFGPSLTLAAWAVLLFGEPFIAWYLSLF